MSGENVRACEQRSPLWRRIIDTSSEEVVLDLRRQQVRVMVEPLHPADLMVGGMLFQEIQGLINQVREPTEDERTALDYADEEAARDSSSAADTYEKSIEWSERAFQVVRGCVTEVYDEDEGRWYPLAWARTHEEAQQIEPPGGAADRRALPVWMLNPGHVQTLLVAALGPAREVAGVIRPFRRE